MSRVLGLLLSCLMAGCLELRATAPQPTFQGEYFVHVVKSKDETLAKILTWYTGTNLSREIVVGANPYLNKRDLKVGDRVLLPAEVVANAVPYNHDPKGTRKKVPNLLMNEDTKSELPQMQLETFHDDTNPDAADQRVATPAADMGDNKQIEQLQREIEAKQRELQRLKQKRPAPSSPSTTAQPPIPPDMEPF